MSFCKQDSGTSCYTHFKHFWNLGFISHLTTDFRVVGNHQSLYFHIYITVQTPSFDKTASSHQQYLLLRKNTGGKLSVGGLLLTVLSNTFLWRCMVDTPHFYSLWRKRTELRDSHGAQSSIWPAEVTQHLRCLLEHEGPHTKHKYLMLWGVFC